MGTVVFQQLPSMPGASQKNNTPNEVGMKICGNLASRTFLIYRFFQLFFFFLQHTSVKFLTVKGLKNAKNLIYVKRVLNSKLKFAWKYDIKIFLAFRKLGAVTQADFICLKRISFPVFLPDLGVNV